MNSFLFFHDDLKKLHQHAIQKRILNCMKKETFSAHPYAEFSNSFAHAHADLVSQAVRYPK